MRKISRRKFIQRGAIAAVSLIALDSLWFEKYVIDWNYFDLSKSKKNKIKFFQITDLHLSTIRSYHRSIAKRINESNPDLIFITGDSVDSTAKIEVLNSFLKLIKPSISNLQLRAIGSIGGRSILKSLQKFTRRITVSYSLTKTEM